MWKRLRLPLLLEFSSCPPCGLCILTTSPENLVTISLVSCCCRAEEDLNDNTWKTMLEEQIPGWG